MKEKKLRDKKQKLSKAAHPSAPQGNQCSIPHFLWQLSKQGPADQYHLTVSRTQVSTHRGRVFLWSYPLTSY